MPTRKIILWLAGALSLYLIAWNVGAGWLYVLTAMLTAYLLLSPPLGWLNTRRLELRLVSSPAATQGERIAARLEIVNKSRLPRLLLELELNFGGGQGRLLLAYLPARRSLQFNCELDGTKRGVYQTGWATISSAAPGGLWRSRNQLNFTRGLVVYPRWFELGRDLRCSNPRGDYAGSRLDASRSRDSEYLGVRGYQPQDSPKAIHWRTTARRGSLATVEYARPASFATVILLDSFAGADAGAAGTGSFESAVSLAASILHHEVKESRAVYLGASLEESVTGGRQRSYDEARYWLAQVRADSQTPLPLDQTAPPGQTDFLILLATSYRHYADLAGSALLASHPGSLVILLDGRGFAGARQDNFLQSTELSQLQEQLQAAGHRCLILTAEAAEAPAGALYQQLASAPAVGYRPCPAS